MLEGFQLAGLQGVKCGTVIVSGELKRVLNLNLKELIVFQNMKHIALLIVLSLGLVILARASEAAQSAGPVIKPGDQLLLDVPSHPELGGVHVVDVRGFLLINPMEPCLLRGLNTNAAADTLSSALARFYRGVENLEVQILRRQMAVRVEGMVNEPGDYFLPYFAGVEEALKSAEGVRVGGLLTRVMIQREDSIIEVDLRKYRITGQQDMLPVLQTGDRIFVPVSNRDAPIMATLAPLEIPFEDPNVIHVMGAVSRGGTHQMPGEVSIFEALALGGGPGRGADLENIRIMPATGLPYEIDLLELAESPESSFPRIAAGTTILVQEEKSSFLTKTLTIAAPLILSAYIIKDF